MSKGTDNRRVLRVEREVQETIARYLISGFKSTLSGIVTVARVKMPGDLRMAKVYVSVLGTPDEGEEVIENLNRRAFEIQSFLGRELKMRFCPKLSFYPDDSTEKILKIERVLSELKANSGLGDGAENSHSGQLEGYEEPDNQ